jgi:hypothetical protein
MSKFIEWFGSHRRKIGYTIGGLNLFMGAAGILVGDYASAVFWLILGGAIVLDTKYFK